MSTLCERSPKLAVELYMIGVTTRDMSKSLEFYRRLGLNVPDGSEGMTHVEIKMSGGLTFFLDSNPARWDPGFTDKDPAQQTATSAPSAYFPFVLEFYLKERSVLDAKYQEMTGLGYKSRQA